MFKSILHSETGSVMLEFCLMLPIYLLIFGGTFLVFDLSMGRLHLQESNRNLAWIQNDRYNDGEKLINKELYKRVTAFYDLRNALEAGMEPGRNFWDFGPKKESTDANGKQVEEYVWADEISGFKAHNIELQINNGWADNLNLSGILDNDYMKLYTGNMYLKMAKVSAVYRGAVGVSSVLFPEKRNGAETVPLYDAAYNLTRVLAVEEEKTLDEAAKFNGEMVIVRRMGEDERKDVNNVNKLFWRNIIFRSWPSNGTLGDVRLFVGY